MRAASSIGRALPTVIRRVGDSILGQRIALSLMTSKITVTLDVISSATLSRLYGAPIEVLRAADGRLVVVGQPEAPFVHGDRHAHA